MLIPRERLQFDLKGAKFDLSDPKDKDFLGWVFNQFLYGEITGIQCGYWLYRAPSLKAASFLAKQASEELSHVKRFSRILKLIGVSPSPPHPAIRFLSTGMMGGSWGEHVTLEMALGEGLVLDVFYVLSQAVPENLQKILESAISEEETHVSFGEKEAIQWLKSHPTDRNAFLGMTLIQRKFLTLLKRYVGKKSKEFPNHPVLSQVEPFFDQLIQNYEDRIQKIGLSSVSLQRISLLRQGFLMSSVFFYKIRWKFKKKKLLTSTYLKDPLIRGEEKKNLLPSQFVN